MGRDQYRVLLPRDVERVLYQALFLPSCCRIWSRPIPQGDGFPPGLIPGTCVRIQGILRLKQASYVSSSDYQLESDRSFPLKSDVNDQTLAYFIRLLQEFALVHYGRFAYQLPEHVAYQ